MKKHKLRLYGKRATQEQIMQEILRLLRGDREKGEDPLSIIDIADRLGFTRSNVYRYTRKAVKAGLLEYENPRRLSIPTNHTSEVSFRRFNERHQILKNPLVAEWKQDLLTRKHGEALSSWKTRLRYLESVCNTCKIKPKKLLR